MLIDDRLATVLRASAMGEASALTQFRQLIDLTGALQTGDGGQPEAAFARLDDLIALLPDWRLAAILREPGLRLRNTRLVARLARSSTRVAAAAMAEAQLSDSEWLDLIPRLPVTARGFLRHRRDLPQGARQVLDRLGVRDLVLTSPAPAPATEVSAPSAADSAEQTGGIAALVRRIEAFRRSRDASQAVSSAVGNDPGNGAAEPQQRSIAFESDRNGIIRWTNALAPFLVGMTMAGPRKGAVAALDPAGWAQMRDHLPLRSVQLEIDAAPAVSGSWIIDAAPMFLFENGAFSGYRGQMRRATPAHDGIAATADDSESDRVRQILHELRTPVNALQGFAEVIQQQVFGPAPNEYRALAAAIAVDAARLMAGFDELDRLARLQSHSLPLAPGNTDMRSVIHSTLQRLDGVLRPRGASIDFEVSGGPFTISVAESEMLQLAWRLLATLAGALGPGEAISLSLSTDGAQMALKAELPASLDEAADIFAATTPAAARAVSAGMFGTGFALRLARAEAQAAGGALSRIGQSLELVLPVLTGAHGGHSVAPPGHAGASPA